MLPCPHIAEQESRDLALLDFLAAFGDAVAPVMAVDVFERLVARIAHAAMHLHGAVGGLGAIPEGLRQNNTTGKISLSLSGKSLLRLTPSCSRGRGVGHRYRTMGWDAVDAAASCARWDCRAG